VSATRQDESAARTYLLDQSEAILEVTPARAVIEQRLGAKPLKRTTKKSLRMR